MATWDDGVWQVSHDGGAVGCDPAFAAIADVVGFEDELLDDEVFVALELGPRWDLLGLDDNLLVDGEFSGLRSFVGARSFWTGRRVWRGPGRKGHLELAGSDLGLGFEAL